MTPLSRRAFLAMVAASAVACSDDGDGPAVRPTGRTTPAPTSSVPGATTTIPVPELPGPPFTLGVASGDPLTDSVILWTRLAPDPSAGGGMPELLVPVRWEVASDEGFNEVVAEGIEIADGARAHSVHVDATGLTAGSRFWYRFHVGEHTSAVGRTRTLPALASAPERVRLAVASCQMWEDGFYGAHRHLAEEDLDAVVWLGDYIYESPAGTAGVRSHRGPATRTLAQYRDRYALYRSDRNLQAAHAAHPWLVTWDDHEVANNIAGDLLPTGEPRASVRERRAAAYQAWWEHQPVRSPAPGGTSLEVYRRFTWGTLLQLLVLDGRQHRTPQPCVVDSSGASERCPGDHDPRATMLGDDQRGWLLENLGESTTRWDVLAQNVLMAPMTDGPFINTDQWDGYQVERSRLLAAIAERDAGSTVVLTGDLHSFGVADLPADPADPASPAVATEILSGSVTSRIGGSFRDDLEAAAASTGAIRDLDADHHGYVMLDIDPNRVQVERRSVATDDAAAPVATIATHVVRHGQPGAVPVAGG